MGLRGSGKSTLGRALAVALNSPCTDLDERTAAHLGAPNAGEAFRRFGEQAFRMAEAEVLGKALAETPHVLALGGGTPTAPGAADLIARARHDGRAFVVFLDAPLDVLARRLRTETGDRPSLTGRGVVEEIEEIAAIRRPLYAALADLLVGRDVCDTPSGLSQSDSLERVVRVIVEGFRVADSAS
jgi:shikimate kinase